MQQNDDDNKTFVHHITGNKLMHIGVAEEKPFNGDISKGIFQCTSVHT